MKAIFVNWTKPFFYKEDAQGYNRMKMADLSDEEYDIVDYELLIQKVAVTRAKKHIGKTKLYTDKIGYEFYAKNNLLGLWDEIDIDTLENFTKENPDVNPGRFWTTGKSVVMGQEPVPFLFLDLDFIIRSDLPKWIYDYDLVHTQWEIQRGEFFVFESEINKYGGIEDFVQNMWMPNTSFIYLNDEKLRDDYLKKHLSIIKRDYDYIPEWLWLLADQGIMGYSARKFNSKVETIENRIYLSYPEQLHPKLVGHGLFWLKDPDRKDHEENLEYEHIWSNKRSFKVDEEYRNMRVSELEKEFKMLMKEKDPPLKKLI